MDQLELLVDLHLKNPRQGPGGEEDTLKALQLIDLSGIQNPKLADVGCGSGGQSITLAKNTNAQITAVDIFPVFLTELEKRATEAEVQDQIKTIGADMADLPFGNNEFDVIWSEGAIYNLGFERGLSLWKPFLKPGGYIALSEIIWITATRPKEIHEFWTNDYPEISSAEEKIKVLQDAGYEYMDHFILPASSWVDHYYKPLADSYESFLKRHQYSEAAQQVVQEHQSEYELFQRFGEYYSYGFFIAKKLHTIGVK